MIDAKHYVFGKEPLQEGFFSEMSDIVYHGESFGVSSTGIKDALISPAHFHLRHIEKVGREETPALKFGRIAHAAILEPNHFVKNYRVQPIVDRRTKKGREEYQEWENSLCPKSIIISEADADKVKWMIDAVMAHPFASQILTSPGRNEHSGFFRDEKTGVYCKIRPDRLLDNGDIVDLKTTRDARFKSFSRDSFEYGYYISLPFYRRGVKQITGQDGEQIIVAVEKEKPFGVMVYVCDATINETGEKKIDKGLNIIKTCTETGNFPCYENEVVNLALPYWAVEDIYE